VAWEIEVIVRSRSALMVRADRVVVRRRPGEAPVGCGGLRTLTDTTGEVKRLFVRPSARYQPIADYDGNPYARYWFEKPLPMRRVD
jgi:N-acetylglutamate synthase-like GNAT family acetyltransferase